MKTTIRRDEAGVVILREDGVVRRFWCPLFGGYVHEIDDRHPGTLGQQVCARLEVVGNTLSALSRDGLIDVIRREHRRGRRIWK
jgi:hypothetical protein